MIFALLVILITPVLNFLGKLHFFAATKAPFATFVAIMKTFLSREYFTVCLILNYVYIYRKLIFPESCMFHSGIPSLASPWKSWERSDQVASVPTSKTKTRNSIRYTVISKVKFIIWRRHVINVLGKEQR